MLESQILRIFAVAGLASALLISTMILLNSGLVSGSAAETTAFETPVTESAPPGSAGDVADPVLTTGETTGAAPEASEEPASEETSEGEGTSTTDTGTQTTGQSTTTHTVQAGDSFYTISTKYNTTIAEIQKLNPDLDPSNLKVGTEVKVP